MTASNASVNILPDFPEQDNASNDQSGWFRRAWYGETDCSWTVQSAGGTRSSCLVIESKNGSDAAWTAIVDIEPGKWYRLSGWIKTQNVKGATGALLNIQNMQHVKTSAVTGIADWAEVSTVFYSGSETNVEINCLFGGWGKSTGKAWFDSIVLIQVDAPKENTEALIIIDTKSKQAPYSPMLFGGFIEHFDDQVYGGLFEPGSPLADDKGFRKDVIEAMKELKLSIVRWPGGCFASGYHWKDGVGKNRKPTPDPVWGVTDPGTFGTDEFVQWCRLVGCEPYICTNAGNGTPDEMKQWVQYCNATTGQYAQMRKANGHEEPFDVKFWSIGNENWGGHEIGAKTPAQWGPLVMDSAKLMLQADPDITLIAAATKQKDWTLPLLKAAGAKLDYVAVHEYYLGYWQKNEMPDYLTCIMTSQEPEKTITEVIKIIAEAGYANKIKIAFDEWNLRGWHHPGFPRKQPVKANDQAAMELIEKRNINNIAKQYTMADALFTASFLNACLRNTDHVAMANIAPIVNTRGPLYVHPEGIVKRTTFHVLAMYANLMKSQVAGLKVTSGKLLNGGKSIDLVDAIATVDKSGKNWAIALVNRHPDIEIPCTVKFDEIPLNGTYDAVILEGDSPEAYNDIDKPNRVIPKRTKITFEQGSVDLPPHSLTILTNINL